MVSRDPKALKRELSKRLLEIDGVTGVGVRRGRLSIYLADDRERTRAGVDEVLRDVAPDASVDFVVTGPFRVQ
jgi:hypothetical protein